MDKNYKIKYLFACILIIFMFVVSEIRLSKGDTNYISADQKIITESPRYSDHSLSINDSIETEEKLEFPMMLRDFIAKTNAKAKITVKNLNPGDSLLFEAAIPNEKTVELLVTNNNPETVDIFNSNVSAIYIKEDKYTEIEKVIKTIDGIDHKKLKEYDVIKLTNSKDANFEFDLNGSDDPQLILSPTND